MPKDFSEAVQPRKARLIGYALNVFPSDSVEDLWTSLKGDVLEIKDRAFPEEPFPIELRFSERIVRELQTDCDLVAQLKHFLDAHDLALLTVNAFVMAGFHGQRVKERVYLPAWHENDRRAHFTNTCMDVLAQLAPMESKFVSVSVPFGALKPVNQDAVAPNILQCGAHAAQVEQRTGVRCVVALEPEPGLCVETTAEVVEFFERFVPEPVRRHLAVNFDLSHQLVEFENLDDSIRQLQQNHIPIAKIHVSNAVEMTELQPFYEDSIYLHQVCGANTAGERVFFSLDWPKTDTPPSAKRFRVHYHVPVCDRIQMRVTTTLDEVERFLKVTVARLQADVPLIVETYTWPEYLRSHEQLVDNICRELVWVREKISLSE